MRFLGVLVLALLPLALSPLGLRAEPAVAPEDARAVRAVIEAQLDAFRRDDAARAFSYASPEIRGMFATPAKFMHMVRTQYAVVYRPASVAFEPPVISEGQVLQPVRFTDAEGRAWGAIYPMWREPDGTWRVDGCYLQRLAARKT